MLCENIDGDHMDCMAHRHHYIDHFIRHLDNMLKSTDTTVLAYIYVMYM